MEIKVENLKKNYGNNVALNGINLELGKGIFGLLGKNGSGKTTLMRIITTLLMPTEGKVSVLGVEANKKNSLQIKSNIGYLPQEFGFYKEFTVYEVLDFISILQNSDKNSKNNKICDILDKVGLAEEKKKKYKQLSGGMKRRLGLAQAMFSNPKILIVDEPTAGVDPEERSKIRKLLSEYSRDNTVLFSTHIVEDIETTCNKLAILDKGNLVFSGTSKEAIKNATDKVWMCTVDNLEELHELEEHHKIISTKQGADNVEAVVLSEVKPSFRCEPTKVTLEYAYFYMLEKKDGGNLTNEAN